MHHKEAALEGTLYVYNGYRDKSTDSSDDSKAVLNGKPMGLARIGCVQEVVGDFCRIGSDAHVRYDAINQSRALFSRCALAAYMGKSQESTLIDNIIALRNQG